MADTTFVDGSTVVAASWLNDINDDVYSRFNVKRYGAVGDGVTDDTTAINNALAAAYALSQGTLTLPYDNIRTGGATVFLPAGKYKTTATLNLYDGVTLEGAGRFSTIITSSYNGPIIRNVIAGYDAFGMGIKHLSIQGDRSKSSQDGISLLRDWNGTYEDVSVANCGRYGWYMLQCIGSTLRNVEALLCVGHNFYFKDGQNSWADSTANNLPSNAVSVYDIHSYGSDAAGIYFGQSGSGSAVNGFMFYGGSAEYNYKSSQGGGNTGYSIQVEGASVVPIEFVNFWVEGGCQAHIYMNRASSDVRFTNLHHFGDGTSGTVDRAVIVNAGTCHLNYAFGHGSSYKTLGGSNAPFTVNTAAGSIRVYNCQGSTISNGKFVEDTAHATTGLYNYVRQTNYGETYGYSKLVTPAADVGQEFQTEGDAQAWLRTTGAKQLQFGSGSATPDAALERKSADVLGMATGDSFSLDGTYNGGNLRLRGAYLWVDSSNRLRIKATAPSSDTDGTVVGTQV